ncbi:hypothetical protein OG21DRAFT_165673 [Imleria badia]|nr:hypothetical protein OG21DRAFT_165673 [Imleria badia]
MKWLALASRLFVRRQLSSRAIPVLDDFVKESRSQAIPIFPRAQNIITNHVRQPSVERGMSETVYHMVQEPECKLPFYRDPEVMVPLFHDGEGLQFIVERSAIEKIGKPLRAVTVVFDALPKFTGIRFRCRFKFFTSLLPLPSTRGCIGEPH